MRKSEHSKLQTITFRVSDFENELIEKEVKIRGLSKSEVIRLLIVEGLSGFDRKQEYMLSRFDKIDAELALLKDIGSWAAASAALPFGVDNQDADEVAKLRKQLRLHFKNSSAIGKNLLELIQDGRL